MTFYAFILTLYLTFFYFYVIGMIYHCLFCFFLMWQKWASKKKKKIQKKKNIQSWILKNSNSFDIKAKLKLTQIILF